MKPTAKLEFIVTIGLIAGLALMIAISVMGGI